MLNLDTLYDTLVATSADGHSHSKPLVARAVELTNPQVTVTPDVSAEELMATFTRRSDLPAIAVIENEVPIGLVNRNIFMEQYGRQYAREIFGRKSCIAFMDKEPLVIDGHTPIETLVKHAVESGGKVLTDGFITTHQGKYLGIGTGFDLLTAMSDIEAEKSKQIMSSINYASLIQRSHLVESDEVLHTHIGEHGLMWSPRDVVGGDAYFFRKVGDGTFGCIFDCTGHGVPGAFMTLIVMSFLEQQINPKAIGLVPGELISQLNVYIKKVLRQPDRPSSDIGGEDKKSNDGLDAAMFVLSDDHRTLRYASAKLSLLIAHPSNADMRVLEASKHPVGYADTPNDLVWETSTTELEPGSLLVIPTDGVIDQIGEDKRIAHGKKRLVQFIQDNRSCQPPELMDLFETHFNQWQGSEKRRDDVTLFAMRTRSH